MKIKPFMAQHDQNRMKHEGDVSLAREKFFEMKPGNLRFLLEKRYRWMNRYIQPGDRGIEVGAGAGFSKEFIECEAYQTTDFADYPWIDIINVDAMHTPFDDSQFDFVVSSNMIHHLAYPVQFFREMRRILKPGGRLLIQEVYTSFFMRFFLRLMRHEGYDFDADVFDESTVANDADDLWSANCAIPNLLFDDMDTFRRNIAGFEVTPPKYREFTVFLNSGGVVAKTFFVPLPRFLLYLQYGVDTVLASLFPKVFALQFRTVMTKV
ncbi:MAG: class I SAM-dependent methyltransferase [Spirochaeta sp.]|jgi:SAM-dependent methyltransferase|nr:class I SAM-dependent methyltransferase [Spirochaeta sp.]